MVDLGAGELVLLGGAGLLAGGVNAVAGGGSLISFPALLAVGYPSVTANVTNNVALLPGYVGGTLAYRDELSGAGAPRAAAGCHERGRRARGRRAAERQPARRVRGDRPVPDPALVRAARRAAGGVARHRAPRTPGAARARARERAVRRHLRRLLRGRGRDHAAGRARRLPARRHAAAQR